MANILNFDKIIVYYFYTKNNKSTNVQVTNCFIQIKHYIH